MSSCFFPQNCTIHKNKIVFKIRHGSAVTQYIHVIISAAVLLRRCCVQVAAVGNITVYVRRYYVRNDVRRILTVVPGLEAKMASNENDQPDDLPEAVVGVDVGTARPTASTSNAIF